MTTFFQEIGHPIATTMSIVASYRCPSRSWTGFVEYDREFYQQLRVAVRPAPIRSFHDRIIA